MVVPDLASSFLLILILHVHSVSVLDGHGFYTNVTYEERFTGPELG